MKYFFPGQGPLGNLILRPGFPGGPPIVSGPPGVPPMVSGAAGLMTGPPLVSGPPPGLPGLNTNHPPPIR